MNSTTTEKKNSKGKEGEKKRETENNNNYNNNGDIKAVTRLAFGTVLFIEFARYLLQIPALINQLMLVVICKLRKEGGKRGREREEERKENIRITEGGK